VAIHRLDFKLTKPQSKAFRLLKPKTDINLEWGRGCGKSFFDRFVGWITIAQYERRRRVEVLEELGWDMADARVPQNMRGARVVYLMPSLKQFKAVHGAGLKGEVSDWAHLRPHANWTDWRVEFPGGSWLQPFPAEAHNSENARGLRADVVICDEADDIDPSVFESIVRPWFSEPWSLKIRLTSGTYKRGRHGLLWQRRVAGKDPAKPRYHTIHATYRESPEIVDPEEVEDARNNSLPAIFAREWECDPDSAEGIVYPFVESFHIREPRASVWSEILIGCDHGYEDPGCFLLIGVAGSGRDAECWVLDEIYEQHKTEDWWKAQLQRWLAWYPSAKFYGDPSMPARIEAYRRDCRAKVQEVDNSIDDGVAAVADRLFIRERTVSDEKTERFAKLFVAPRCANTIREFGLYRRKRDTKNREAFKDDIEDRNNHAMDALRYAIFNRFGPVTATERRYGRAELRQ
jgi:hypothetical protein